ncbi:hypothetical protein FACS1894122_08990 [Alphaproteobacteria bacterium]|nr:hypothetical protein FACS1894122_08990 [Alphaproteobacteria bacterium]
MRNFLLLFKVLLFLLPLVAALYFGGNIVVDFCGESFSFHIVIAVLACEALVIICCVLCSITRRIRDLFHEHTDYEKGLSSLQLAFSGILLKDAGSAEYNIRKAKKHLGDLPIVGWIEGQICLANNEHHRAKSIFYSLCERENNTALGAYSLCQMAAQEKSAVDALNAINEILKIYPDSIELAFQAISVALRSHNYYEARRHIPAIRKTKKAKVVEALVCSEEGMHTNDISLVVDAYELAPELIENSIYYVDFLIKEKRYKDARKALLKAYEKNPTMELFCRYISCEQDASNLDKIGFAEKAVDLSPLSWIGYYGLGEIAMHEGLYKIAFENLLLAYGKKHYNFIADKLVKSASSMTEKPQSAIDILSSTLETENVEFVWKCKNCGSEDAKWISICPHCDRIAEYEPFERIVNSTSRALQYIENEKETIL